MTTLFTYEKVKRKLAAKEQRYNDMKWAVTELSKKLIDIGKSSDVYEILFMKPLVGNDYITEVITGQMGNEIINEILSSGKYDVCPICKSRLVNIMSDSSFFIYDICGKKEKK